MISAILFDLIGTLIEESSTDLSIAEGYYKIRVKAIHDSLEKDGISIDWTLFMDKYKHVRAIQVERSKKTLKEYDMYERISKVLLPFDYIVSPTSPIITRAVDTYFIPYMNSLKMDQNTLGLLKTLSVNYKLGLVTNFAYVPGAYSILEKFGLKNFFKTIVISGEVGWKKPSNRIFEAALSKLSVKSEETVFVGDDYENDIEGAQKMGMKTVFLCKRNLNGGTKGKIINSLTELLLVIKQI